MDKQILKALQDIARELKKIRKIMEMENQTDDDKLTDEQVENGIL